MLMHMPSTQTFSVSHSLWSDAQMKHTLTDGDGGSAACLHWRHVDPQDTPGRAASFNAF